MKLILLAKHFIPQAQEALAEFTEKSPVDTKIAFSGNSADKEENPVYVEDARQEFVDAGYQLTDLDLRKYEGKIPELMQFLKSFDAIYFSGGNVYYLMSLFNKIGLTGEYKKILEDGLIHMGASAGACVCSEKLDAYKVFDLQSEAVEHGLGFFHYYILPHYGGKEKYARGLETLLKEDYQNVIPLTNHQGIVVEDDEWRIIQD